MKIEFVNGWKDLKNSPIDMFGFIITKKRQFVINILGWTYFKKNSSIDEHDTNSLFFHFIDGHYHGYRKDALDDKLFLSLTILGFSVIIDYEDD